ncbi:MAG: sortase [Microgenomates group bacterium]
MKRLLGKFFTILGAAFLGFSTILIVQRFNPSRITFNNYEPLSINACRNVTYLPRIIRIPSLHKTLPIIPATINDGKWTLTDKGISYLTSSKIPGEEGNGIMYGHNWESLLGGLEKIKPGSKIEIEYTNGMKRTFIVQVTANVSPDQTNVLKQSHDKRLTLYTCSGFLDTQRFVVVATLENEIVAMR